MKQPIPTQLPAPRIALSALLVLLVLGVCTGITLLVYPTTSLFHLNVLRWHGVSCLLLVPPMGYFLARHLAPALSWRAWLFLGSALPFWAFAFATGFSPPIVPWLLGAHALGLAVYFARKFRAYRRIDPASGPLLIAGFSVLVPTGLILGVGMFHFNHEGVSSTALYSGHRWASVVAVVPLIVHGILLSLRWLSLNGTLVWLPSGAAAIIALAISGSLLSRVNVSRTRPDSHPRSPVAALHSLDAEWCGGCHREVYDQWVTSAHRFSSTNTVYRKVVSTVARNKGMGVTSLCARCHNPLYGSLGLEDPVASGDVDPISGQGVTCTVCHMMSRVPEEPFNGEYSLSLSTGYDAVELDSSLSKEQRAVLHKFIAADTRPHRRSMGHFPQRDSRRCLACHRVRLPEMSPSTERRTIEDVVTSWRDGPFGKHPQSCVLCHAMETFVRPSPFYFLGNVPPNHHMPGIQTALSLIVAGAQEKELARTNDEFVSRWLEGLLPMTPTQKFITLLHTRDDLSPYEPHLTERLPLRVELSASTTGAESTIVVTTHNARVGHDFPSGAHDFSEVWLEVTATTSDDPPRSLFQSGVLDQRGYVDPKAIRLGAKEFDRSGKEISQHQVLDVWDIRDVQVISPGKSRQDILRGPPLPAGSKIKARWLYRRYKPAFAQWALGVEPASVPIVVVGSSESITSS